MDTILDLLKFGEALLKSGACAAIRKGAPDLQALVQKAIKGHVEEDTGLRQSDPKTPSVTEKKDCPPTLCSTSLMETRSTPMVRSRLSERELRRWRY